MDGEELVKKQDTKKIKKLYIILAIVIFVVVLIDQITKICAINIGDVQVIENVLKISVSENKSGAYGIGSDSTIMYIITNLVVIAVLFKFITSQNEFIDTKIKIFSSLIIAGGISNVIDRIIRGYVVEFIDFKQIINIPSINLADICVIIGWVSFIAVFTGFSVREIQANRAKKEVKLQDNKKEEK